MTYLGQPCPEPPEGLHVIGPDDPGGFSCGRPPGKSYGPITQPYKAILIHDSISPTTSSCYNGLTSHNFGTGAMLDPDGTLFVCLNEIGRSVWHAGPYNRWCFGLDVIGWLDPNFKTHVPKARLHAPSLWATKGYIDYTEAQKVALPLAVGWLVQCLRLPEIKVLWHSEGYLWTMPYGKACPKSEKPAEFFALHPDVTVLAHSQICKPRWDGNRAIEVLAGPKWSR